jgi:hypothetical protein
MQMSVVLDGLSALMERIHSARLALTDDVKGDVTTPRLGLIPVTEMCGLYAFHCA